MTQHQGHAVAIGLLDSPSILWSVEIDNYVSIDRVHIGVSQIKNGGATLYDEGVGFSLP